MTWGWEWEGLGDSLRIACGAEGDPPVPAARTREVEDEALGIRTRRRAGRTGGQSTLLYFWTSHELWVHRNRVERESDRLQRARRARRRHFDAGIRPQPIGRVWFDERTARILGSNKPFAFQSEAPPCRTLDDMTPEEIAALEKRYGAKIAPGACKKKAG